jgi:uncharacterized membrane protein
MKKRRRFLEDERGQVLYQTALGLMTLLVFLGLVIDGGLMLANYRRAQLTADTAAQAASHAVSIEVFWASNSVVLASEAAEDRAEWIIDQNGIATDGRRLLENVQVTCGANWVRVTGRAQLPTFFMRMFGIPEVHVPVRSVAYPAYGIEHEWE